MRKWLPLFATCLGTLMLLIDLNLPIAAATILLSALVFEPSRRHAKRGVDVPGMLAFAIAATALTSGIIRGGEHGWSDSLAVSGLITGVVAIVLFVVIETLSAAPMLPRELLRHREFGVALIAAASSVLRRGWPRQRAQMGCSCIAGTDGPADLSIVHEERRTDVEAEFAHTRATTQGR